MKNSFASSGRLFLIPVPLGENQPNEVLPVKVKEITAGLDHFIVENEKTARRFIKSILPEKEQAALKIKVINKFTKPEEIPGFLDICNEGLDVGVLSEAGCPGIADPGAEIVRIAHERGIQVIPLVGPSSILLAMMSSGLNGQSFTFHGYLSIDKGLRKNEIKNLEKLSFEKNQAQIFIETPYRNQKLFEDLLKYLHPATQICIACDITLTTEFIVTKPGQEWKKSTPDLHKRPTIFIIQKQN